MSSNIPRESPDEIITNFIRNVRINDNEDRPQKSPGETSGTTSEEVEGKSSHPEREDGRAALSTRIICTDVTEKFKSSVAKISNGQMAAEDGFSLFDAIGAIEIMDPKMDSGFRPPGEPPDEYDVTRKLAFKELVWICDRLLACFAAWHKGFLLTQTILTSHYVDSLLRKDGEAWSRLISIGDIQQEGEESSLTTLQFLDLFCISLVRSIGFAITQIRESNAPIWEEEDISTQSHGLSLFSNISESQIMKSIGSFAILMQTNPIFNPVEQELLFHYLTLASKMVSGFGTPENSEVWHDASRSLAYIQKNYDHDSLLPVPGAFSPRLQQRYASSTPMRGMVEFELDETFTVIDEILFRAEINTSWLENYLPLRGSSLALTTLSRVPRLQFEQLAYTKALMSSALWNSGSFIERLKDEMAKEWLVGDPIATEALGTLIFSSNEVAESSQHPALQIASSLDTFLVEAVEMDGGYVDYYRAMWSNRSRNRRTMCRVINGFHILEQNAPQFDNVINEKCPKVMRRPLETWALTKKLESMAMVIELGFELNLYDAHETLFMYWFLEDTVYRLMQVHQRLPEDIKRLHRAEAVYWNLVYNMAKTFGLLYSTLIKMGHVRIPEESEFARLTDFWELRMKPFIRGGESVHTILAKIQSIYVHLKTPGSGIFALENSILETSDSWKACTELDIEVAADPYMSSLGRVTALVGQLSMMEKDRDSWRCELQFLSAGEGDIGNSHPSYISPHVKPETLVQIHH